MNAPNGDDRSGLAALLTRLRVQGIGQNLDLIAAIEQTPRRGFVPSQWSDAAWTDRSIPIGCGETLDGVDLQIRVIDALEVEPGHRVLEVGTGSGYSAALLARLSSRVLSVERYRTLAEEARRRIGALGIGNAVVKHADGSSGSPAEAPYDRIVVWAAFETLPRAFADQLATNGIMIAPIGTGDGEQELAKLVKVGSRFERHDIGRVRLQPIDTTAAAIL